MATLEIVPGPVHSNVELTGVIVLLNTDVVCKQVIVVGITGKFIDGVLKSCVTITEPLSEHKLDGGRPAFCIYREHQW